MKGLKLQPQPSKKDQMRSLETELKNSQVAARMSQLLIQQLMNNIKAMSEDLTGALAQLYELQYKYEALRQCANVDSVVLNSKLESLRLKDFKEAAERQDIKEELFDVELASEESTVVLTSVATDETGKDKGIFRSRVKLSESGSPDLVKAMVGQKVGYKAVVKLNGLDHTIELLSIKNGPSAPASESSH